MIIHYFTFTVIGFHDVLPLEYEYKIILLQMSKGVYNLPIPNSSFCPITNNSSLEFG
jgi:hypothetical protein